jgi:hypothetical protein
VTIVQHIFQALSEAQLFVHCIGRRHSENPSL